MRDLVYGKGWFLGYIENVLCCYLDERMDEGSFPAYLKAVADDIDHLPEGVSRGILYEVSAESRVTAPQRSQIAQVLKDRRPKLSRCATAYAFCNPSALIRGMTTAINWLASPPYPHTTKPTVREGLVWLAQKDARIDAQKALQQYEALKTRALALLA